MQYGGTVYILTNVHHEVLYIGVTSDLLQEFQSILPRFIQIHLPQNIIAQACYYETFGRIEDAIAREKQLKKRNRSWKNKLIFGFQSRVERFIYWPLKLLRADARSGPGMTAPWLPYVPAAN